ncbi:MAG: hypothetical protein G01um101431_636 [Parcubacteria group bacterium Gr01-1014_31]|nr:MAG: hypothetical protein G01um101431_636 [Parcubacteria group bacterium Gr01-1014_31]
MSAVATPHRFAWAAVAIGALALIVANGSLLYGFLQTPAGTRFIGVRTLMPADPPVYYSYLRQIEDGNLTLRDIFTAEPQPVGTLNVLWLALGAAGRLFRLTPAATFHASRVLLGVVLLAVLYRGIAWFLTDRWERVAAFALTLSGGVGIWATPFLPTAEYLERGAGYRWPLDLWLPWSSPILSLGSSPHLVASWALLVGTLLLAARAAEQWSWRAGWSAGIAAAVLLNFHPYHWPTLLAVPVGWLLLRWRNERRAPLAATPYLLPLFLAVAGSLVYHAWLLAVDPVSAARALQNISRLPPLPYVLVGLGAVAVLAVFGARTYFSRTTTHRWWAGAWLAAATVLALLPSQFQARYLQGLLFPLSIIAAPAAVTVFRWVMRRGGWLGVSVAAVLAAAVLLGSPLGIAARDLQYYRKFPASYYFPDDFFAAADWVHGHIRPGEIILAAHDSGMWLGAYTARTQYYGHGDETINSAAKRPVVEQFYTSSDPAFRAALLKRTGARYVWYGFLDRAAAAVPPDTVPGLIPVFANSAGTMFRVAE